MAGTQLAIGCLALFACASDRERPVDTPPGKSCAADRIPALRRGYLLRKDCAPDTTVCLDACRTGDADACFTLAINAQRANAPSAESTALFEQACQLGLATGCTNWGAGLWAGDSRNIKVSCLRRIFARSCEARDVFGCAMVGRMTLEYARTPEAIAKGKAELEDACETFKGPPCHFLAFYIEKGMFGKSDPERIKVLMARACEGGDPRACGDHVTVDETMSSRR
jgi:uncharacterized protein